MATITIESLRRDGKYMVATTYAGAPNAFGGFYPSRTYRNLLDRPTLIDRLARLATDDAVTWGPAAGLRPAVATRRAEVEAAREAKAYLTFAARVSSPDGQFPCKHGHIGCSDRHDGECSDEWFHALSPAARALVG